MVNRYSKVMISESYKYMVLGVDSNNQAFKIILTYIGNESTA